MGHYPPQGRQQRTGTETAAQAGEEGRRAVPRGEEGLNKWSSRARMTGQTDRQSAQTKGKHLEA